MCFADTAITWWNMKMVCLKLGSTISDCCVVVCTKFNQQNWNLSGWKAINSWIYIIYIYIYIHLSRCIYMAVSQNVKPRSIPWIHRPIHTRDPYQNAGDPDRSIRLDHRGPIHDRILTQPHICIICMYIDTDIPTYIHTNIHTYIHKFIHTYLYNIFINT